MTIAKIKKFFSKLQYRFLVVFILMSILPLVLMTAFTVNIYSSNLKNQAETNVVFQLRSIDETIFEKVKNIQRFVDILSVDSVISKELSKNVVDCFAIESALKKSASSCDGIEGLLLVLPSSESISYNIDTSVVDIVRLQVIYNSINNQPNALTWFDTTMDTERVGINKNLMLVGTTYEYTDYYGKIKNAKVYIFADKAIFVDVLEKSSAKYTYITDKNGIIIASNGDEKYGNLVKENYDTMSQVYTLSEGSVENTGDDTFNVSVYTSNSTKFKYVSVNDFKELYAEADVIKGVVLVILLVLLMLFAFLYIYIVNRITKPISRISEIMKHFDDTTLCVRIPVEGNDEVADIAIGFNKMMDRLNLMIEETEHRKEVQKDAEIKALSYQINPHFLYNTLSAIRIEALNKNDKKVAENLMYLSKILKSVFSHTNKYVTLNEEFEISRNTVSLLQLRYNSDICFNAGYEPEYGSIKIPSMILQPVIENCVLHGLAPKLSNADFQAKINVFAERENCDFIIRIIDNGVGMEERKIKDVLSGNSSEKHGIGLYNVDERIKLLYGDEYGIAINSRPQGSVAQTV